MNLEPTTPKDLGLDIDPKTGNFITNPIRESNLPAQKIELISERELGQEAEDVLNRQFESFIAERNAPVDSQSGPIFGDGFLVHNTSFDLSKLDHIFRLGVISGEVSDGSKPLQAEQNETHYCADFFRVEEDKIREVMGDVVDNNLPLAYYSFAKQKTQLVNSDGSVSMLKMNRPEAYLSPSLNNDCLSFVFNPNEDRLQELMKYSTDGITFKNDQNSPLSSFVNRFPGSTQDSTNHIAVLVGLPANHIKSIVVGGRLASSPDDIKMIHDLIKKYNLSAKILNVEGVEI